MLGGDTFGIHDDDAYYCKAGSTDRYCGSADKISPYVDHTVTARSLMDQLEERHLTWKGYYESIPEPGSKVVYWPDEEHPVPGQPTELYAVKHTAFMQFRSVQDDPALATKIVGFDRLDVDLASGQVPSYAHIVPNQCNEMHGRNGPNVPIDCRYDNDEGRIARGDKAIGALFNKIQASPIWSAPGLTAIVITWDEDDDPPESQKAGLLRLRSGQPANFGGGHIPTIVITNHGPRRDRQRRTTTTLCCAPPGTRSASASIWAMPPTRRRASSRWCGCSSRVGKIADRCSSACAAFGGDLAHAPTSPRGQTRRAFAHPTRSDTSRADCPP